MRSPIEQTSVLRSPKGVVEWTDLEQIGAGIREGTDDGKNKVPATGSEQKHKATVG
ncbi:MAG: hypothetical protein QF745_11625 [Planctomycetota bacterium]|nr:hypothetical protein [Planctomycetota bacterium]